MRHVNDTRRRVILLASGAALAGLSLASDSPFNLLERANEAYREGRVSRALDLYEEADELGADDPLTLYNWGTALAASNERGLAERMFRKADEHAQSDDVRARARFNLAHSLFVTASTLTEEDPRRAIELFDESAKAAKSALRLNPADREAASHVEISRLAAQLVRDQLAMAERMRELANQQREQSRASQDAHHQQEQREQQQEQQQESQQQEQGEQQQQPQPSEQAPQQQEQQPPEQGEQQDQQQSDEAGEPPQAPDMPSWLQDLLGPRRPADEGQPTPQAPEQSEQQPAEAGEQPEQGGEPNAPESAGQNESQEQRARSQGRQPPGDQPQQPEGQSQDPTPEQPSSGDEPSQNQDLGEAQQELNTQTEGIAETLRKAIENDLVAGDREFAEAVLRAIEQARESQDDAQENLSEQQFDEAASEQQQAATLLEMAEQITNRTRSRQPRESQDAQSEENQQPQGSGQGEQVADEEAQELLDKERNERELRRAYQRRIMRGRRAPARDW